MKTCIGCKKELSFEFFYIKKDRVNQYSSRCKTCHCLSQKNRNKEYYAKYYNTVLKSKRNTEEYKEKIKIYNKNYRKTEAYIEYNKKYRQTDTFKNLQKNYVKNRRKNDINFLLCCRLRGRVRGAIKDKYKTGSSIKDLGCSIEELKVYIESKFTEGMSWDNRIEWHIDHVIPLSSFNLSDRKEFLKACHYTNLQPLWAYDNRKKGGNIIDSDDLARWKLKSLKESEAEVLALYKVCI